MRIEHGFQFTRPHFGNAWSDDAPLRLTILRLMLTGGLPASKVPRLFDSLHTFGHRCETEIAAIAATLDSPTQEPTLVQYDQWGKRIDRLVTAPGWKRLKQIGAEEGIVAESYDSPFATRGLGRRELGQHARLFAFARSVLFVPVCKSVLCPISMSDGAVRVLELHGTPSQKALIPRLCTTDGPNAWTAGQWMTERPGGSDVARSETTARPILPLSSGGSTPQPGDRFILDGFKWFSSATDGDISLALARTDPDLSKGSRGLSLFLIRLRDERTGELNGIRVHRLKRKLGTKYLPTAELELDGAIGELVGELGRGVPTIASVLNITRMYSASGAIGAISWGLRQCTSFAQSRPALGGKRLDQLHLHTDQLLKVTVAYRALLQLFFSSALNLGAVESNTATERQKTRFRLLTPALKAFSATRGTEPYLTLMESMGGQGYMEENGFGDMIMTASVERIWEGSPSILSLDVLRVVTNSGGKALQEFLEDAAEGIRGLAGSGVGRTRAREGEMVLSWIHRVGRAVSSVDMDRVKTSSDFRFTRHLLDGIMVIHASVLLLQHAAWLESAGEEVVRLASIPGGLDGLARQAEEASEMARLWISAGYGDAVRVLDQLEAAVSPQAEGEAELARRVVYGWGHLEPLNDAAPSLSSSSAAAAAAAGGGGGARKPTSPAEGAYAKSRL